MTTDAPIPEPGRPLVLRRGKVLTMNDAHDLLEETDVLVIGERIEAVGPALDVPEGTFEIDGQDDFAERIKDAAQGEVDVTIDMLWGPPALAAMSAAARFARHVEVGNMAAPEIALPAPLIRSASLDVRGFSVAHPPLDLKRDAYLRLTKHAADGDIAVDVDPRPLDEVADAWERQRQAAGGPKMVLVP